MLLHPQKQKEIHNFRDGRRGDGMALLRTPAAIAGPTKLVEPARGGATTQGQLKSNAKIETYVSLKSLNSLQA